MLSRQLRAFLVLSLAALPEPGLLASTASVQSRLDALQASREPVVAHVVVALCDNENQGIVPVQAYTLDAAVRTLLEGGSSADIHESAAQAYHAYQRCGIRGARGLFHVE